MNTAPYHCLPVEELPAEPGWLLRQGCPVIAVGEEAARAGAAHARAARARVANADVVVSDQSSAEALIASIERTPVAALTLVQVLRSCEQLPVEAAMTVESLAYATLQAGAEYQAWLQAREEAPALVSGGRASRSSPGGMATCLPRY